MKTVDEYYQDIEPLIQNGWYAAAILALEQLLQAKPDFARGYHELGTLQSTHGDKNKALECYQKCIELDRHNIGYLKSLADFYHAGLEQVEAALGVYEKIFELDETDVDCLFIAANLNVVQHNFDKALIYYQKVLAIDPSHAEASEYLNKIKAHQTSTFKPLTPDELYRQSHQAGGAGDVAAAISALEQLLAQQPDHAIAHNDLGVYYQRSGELDNARRHYEAALELDPFNITFEKNFADFQFAVMGDVTAALKHYLNVLKRYPEDTEVLMAAGHVCRAIDKLDDAELFFSRVLEIEPWSIEARDNLENLKNGGSGKRAVGL